MSAKLLARPARALVVVCLLPLGCGVNDNGNSTQEQVAVQQHEEPTTTRETSRWQRAPDRANRPQRVLVRSGATTRAPVRGELSDRFPDMGRPPEDGVVMLADTAPQASTSNEVNETLEDGTVVTGTHDPDTGAFDLTYAYPDGSSAHVVGSETVDENGNAQASYAVDVTYPDGASAHWDVVESTVVAEDGTVTNTVTADGGLTYAGRTQEFHYASTEVVHPDGSITLDEVYDDLATPVSPDGTLHLDIAPDGTLSGTMTGPDEMGETHSCSFTGTVEAGPTGNMVCDGEEIPDCALDDTCNDGGCPAGTVRDVDGNCVPADDPCADGGCQSWDELPVGQGTARAARGCETDNDCDGGWCLAAGEGVDPTVAPRGYCATFCWQAGDCGAGDWECLPASDDPSAPGICGRLCAIADECPFSGASCNPVGEEDGQTVGLCVEP
ncbi:MAG: hypothetical protein AB2A00_02835 [Myxococcota bacterium]